MFFLHCAQFFFSWKRVRKSSWTPIRVKLLVVSDFDNIKKTFSSEKPRIYLIQPSLDIPTRQLIKRMKKSSRREKTFKVIIINERLFAIPIIHYFESVDVFLTSFSTSNDKKSIVVLKYIIKFWRTWAVSRIENSFQGRDVLSREFHNLRNYL